MSMAADGKIATANRAVSSFSSAGDQRHLLELRATADAVMCGARTADLNRITLGPGGGAFRRARIRRGLREFNLRIVVSPSGTLDPRAHLFADRRSPVVVLTTSRCPATRLARLREVADVVRVCGCRAIEWDPTLRWLRTEWKVHRLLCEGGGELNSALFRAGIVDEIHVTLCPKIIGGREAPTISDGLGGKLRDAAKFEIQSVRRTGDEFFLVLAAHA